MLIAIRKGIPSDAEDLFKVHKASVEQLCAGSYSSDHLECWFEGRTPEIHSTALAAGQIWVAVQGGTIIGFVGVQTGEITLLFVAPEANGMGVGSSLLKHALALPETKASAQVLVVATKNSESFYSAHGFISVGDEWFERGSPALRYPVVRMLGSFQSGDV